MTTTPCTSALQALPQQVCVAKRDDWMLARLCWLHPAGKDRAYQVTESVGPSCGCPKRSSLFYCICIANKLDVAPTCFPILFTHVGIASGGFRETEQHADELLRNKEGHLHLQIIRGTPLFTELPTA